MLIRDTNPKASAPHLCTISKKSSIRKYALPVINLYQFDVTNIDLTKVLYYSCGINKDSWNFTYLTQIDPLATAASYGAKTADASGKREFSATDIRFVQTFGVTYQF